ncbi:MAG: sigma-70 family RNA polymerase sigma factor [Phycisphaerales bacterium]|nr:sigma-70 family RNA polymerase sigma factor [Phycisphaerales bacterium]
MTLLNRMRVEGDSAAWREFTYRYGALVRAVARRNGLQAADADDVLQNVLIGLSKALPHFCYDPLRARFRTFLQCIVQRVIYQRFRQKKAGGAIQLINDLQGDDPADTIWEAEWRQYHLRRAMEAIDVEFTTRDRTAFTMYIGSKKPAAETAETLGISVDQVYQAKSRIMKRLEELIAMQIKEEG